MNNDNLLYDIPLYFDNNVRNLFHANCLCELCNDVFIY